MKILLGIDTWYPKFDGVVVTVENYCKYLNEGGTCEVVVPNYKVKDESAAHAEHARFVKSFRLPVFKGYACPLPSLDGKLEQEIKNGGYDVLHAHSPFTIGDYFVKMGKKYGIPTAYTFHTKFKDEFEARFKEKLIPNYMMKRIMKTISGFDKVFAVSEGSAETLRSYGYKGDITVIRNGTDMPVPTPEREKELLAAANREFGLENAKNVLLYVGRLVEVKNIPFSLKVFKMLKDAGEDVCFVIVGEGEDEERLRGIVKDLGIENEVKFVGKVTDRELLQGIYLRSDLLLLPSVFDNASLTILEAACGKLPAMVPTGSSISEVISNGENGFIIDEKEEVWAEKVHALLLDKSKLKSAGESAAKTIYRTWKDVVDEVKTEYAKLKNQ